MKKLLIAMLLVSTSVLAQVSEEQVKNFSFDGNVLIVFEQSNLELWNDHLTLQTDQKDNANFIAAMKNSGIEVLSGIYGNEKTGLIVTTVKLLKQNNQLSVMVFDSVKSSINFYNISEISLDLIRSKDPHYSDLLFKVSK